MNVRKVKRPPSCKHDPNTPGAIQLRDLAAYRLLEHFKGDWKAAQRHVKKHGDGYPYWRGEKEWREAAARADKLISAAAMFLEQQWN
jgi:hypothetical protein